MRKIQILLFTLLFLSGCATYRFHNGQPPYDKGYVVSRGDNTILEYTIGRDNSVPELQIAKERFKRRKGIVEYYYKKMGYLENSFKQAFWDPPALFIDFIGGIFRMPFIAAKDYKYEHNPQYREGITRQEEKQDAYEAARIKNLKEGLNAYIQKDLTVEAEAPIAGQMATKQLAMLEQETTESSPNISGGVEQKSIEKQQQPAEQEKNPQQKEEQVRKMLDEQSRLRRTKPQPISGEPVAVIIAKPTKGFSPLKVQFYGYKSHSPYGNIVSYNWDFGDGDTSTKKNPANTYLSTTYSSRYFTATLTIKDDKGNTASSSAIIEVITK